MSPVLRLGFQAWLVGRLSTVIARASLSLMSSWESWRWRWPNGVSPATWLREVHGQGNLLIGLEHEELAHKGELLIRHRSWLLLELELSGAEKTTEATVTLGDHKDVWSELELFGNSQEDNVDLGCILVIIGEHGEVGVGA